MILGYILTVVYINFAGDVQGRALNYHTDINACYEEAVELKLQSEPGIGYVCLEDTPELGERI